MKNSFRFYIVAVLLPAIMLLASCKKPVYMGSPLASMNLVNATVNLSSAVVNVNSQPDAKGGNTNGENLFAVDYGTNTAFSLLANQMVGLTIFASDSLNVIFHTTVNFNNGDLYSLYLCGALGSVDTLMMQEHFPVYSDSSSGVRFVNLSQGSTPVNVTLAQSPSVNEFSNIAYRQVSTFNTYAATMANASYTFNVLRSSDDSLLSTYMLSIPIFKNVTLALIGNSMAGLSVIRINNY